MLRLWRDNLWPVVRRRGCRRRGCGEVPVAVSLPPPHTPRRFGFAVPAASVREVARPPLLSDVVAQSRLPDPLADLADAVLGTADRIGAEARVFGSCMWRHVTGLPTVGPASDLDCLWDGVAPAEVPALVRRLRGLPGAARLDGEIAFEGVGEVSWRELAAPGGGPVLARCATAVRLVERRTLGLPGC